MTVDGDEGADGRRTGDGRADGVVVRERRSGEGGSAGSMWRSAAHRRHDTAMTVDGTRSDGRTGTDGRTAWWCGSGTAWGERGLRHSPWARSNVTVKIFSIDGYDIMLR